MVLTKRERGVLLGSISFCIGATMDEESRRELQDLFVRLVQETEVKENADCKPYVYGTKG